MSLAVLGLNHNTADLAYREKIAFSPSEQHQQVAECLERWGGTVLLSTCNRTELYVPEPHLEAARAWLQQHRQLSAESYQRHFYERAGQAALEHLIRVAAGLDSMVLGEPQVLGQLKSAVALARQLGASASWLDESFALVFATAKKIRTHTDIGRGAVSMAACAVRLAEGVFGPLAQRQLLCIGAGDMVQFVAEHFAAAKMQLLWANRTEEKAQAVARRLGGSVHRLVALEQLLVQADVVVSGTSSALAIVGKGLVERALKQRKHRPLCVIDLALPRDVEPEVGQLEDVFLYTVDDLGRLAERSQQERSIASAAASEWIEQALNEHLRQQRRREGASPLAKLQQRLELLRQHSLEQAAQALERGEEPLAVLEKLQRDSLAKASHPLFVTLRQALEGEHHEALPWLLRASGVEEEG